MTSAVYLQHRSELVATAGSADGVVKVWDLRKSHTRRVNPVALASSPDFTTSNTSHRSHGLSSLALSGDGTSLYALSTAASIYEIDALDVTRSRPLKTYIAPVDPAKRGNFRVGSFYVKLAVSAEQNGRFLAAGSSESSLWLWDTKSDGTDPVSLTGHEQEVGGLDWCSSGLATCGDDVSPRH